MSAARQLAIDAFVTALCVAVAFVATRPDDVDARPDERVLVRCDAPSRVVFEGAEQRVELTADPPRVLLEVPTEDGATRRRRLRANERARELLEGFTVRGRPVPDLEGAAFGDVGLGEGAARAVFQCGGEETELAVGTGAFGSDTRYVRAEGRVHLASGDVLGDLERAGTRLVEHRLSTVERAEVLRVRLRRPGADPLAMQQLERRTLRARFVDPDATDERRREYDRVMRAVFGLAVQRELQAGGEGEALTTVELLDHRGEVLDTIEVRRRAGGETGATWLGRSQSTRADGVDDGWVELLPTSAATLTRALERLAD